MCGMRRAKVTAAWLAAVSFVVAGALLAAPGSQRALAQQADVSGASALVAPAVSYAPSRLAAYSAGYRQEAARSSALRHPAARRRVLATAAVAPGGYADPLRAVTGLTLGR